MNKLFYAGIAALLLFPGYSRAQDSIRHYDLDEVSVSASRTNIRLREIPQKVEIIDESVIQTVPSENFAELIKRTTNLDIVQYTGMSSKISMRGFSPSSHSRSYTLLLIDGKPAGTVNLSTVNTAFIRRIEVIKGPYSTLYGSDAMGGVINIITRRAQGEASGNLTLEGGSFGVYRMSGEAAGPIGKQTSFAIGFSRRGQMRDYRIGSKNLLQMSGLEKLILDPSSGKDVMKNSAYQINHYTGQITQTINRSWKFDLLALYSNADDVETPGNYWGSYGTNKKDFDRMSLYGTLHQEKENNHFQFGPYFTRENSYDYSNDSDTGFVNFESHVQEWGFKMHDNISFGNFSLLAGADLDVYEYASNRFSAKATPANPYQPDYSNTKTAVFSQISYSIGGLFLNGGLRYDFIYYDIAESEGLNGSGGSEVFHSANPSLGIRYTFPFKLKLHSSYGRAFSVPDAFKVAGSYSVSEYFADWDFWWISYYEGNPDLKPESSNSFDVGASYTLQKLLNFDLTYFSSYHKDKIVEYALGMDSVSFRNADRAQMSGLELLAASDVGSLFDNRFKLELYANYTLNLRNSMEELHTDRAGNDSIATKDLLYTRRASGTFGIYFDNYKGFSTRLNARYSGSRLETDNFSLLRPEITEADYFTEGGYTANDRILKMPDFLIFDYSVFYTFRKHLKIGLILANLFDEKYHEKDGYHLPGRMITGSISYNF